MLDEENDSLGTAPREPDALDLVIEELEERTVMKWACGCSCTCNCSTSSCVVWTA